MQRRLDPPKFITWIICLICYVVALLCHFGVIHPQVEIATWSWIIGFGLLLAACHIRGL